MKKKMRRFVVLAALTVGFSSGIVARKAFAADLLIADVNPNRVLRYDGSTGAFVGEFIPALGQDVNVIQSMAVGPNGNLYIATLDRIKRFDGSTGAFIDDFVPPGSGGLTIQNMVILFGPDGHLYVGACGGGNPGVLRFNGLTGVFMGIFVPVGSGGLVCPSGRMAFGPDGRLYVPDIGNDVLRYDGQTGAFVDAFVPNMSGGLFGPTGVAFLPDGDLLVASRGGNPPGGAVLRYSGQSGAFVGAFVPEGSGGLDAPRDLAFGPDGNLYVIGVFNHIVKRYDGITGAFIDDFVPSGSGGLEVPGYLAFAVFAPAPVCDIQLTQAHYVDGETITASVFRFANPRAVPVAVEIKGWLGLPTGLAVGTLNVGANGAVMLPAAFDMNLGPVALGAVVPATPRGLYEFSCRLLNPTTGAQLAVDRNRFTIQ